jgi:metallo-beta-lactamase family protein
MNNVEDERNTILLVGYMAEYTLGRRIKNREKQLKIFGDFYNLNAHVEEINGLSGHADYKEMLEYLKSMDTSALKKIFLVHGDPEPQQTFKKFLMENGFPNVVIVEKNKKYTLD